MTADLTSQVLDALAESDGSLLSNVVFPSVVSTTVKSALDRLASREMVVYRIIEQEKAILTPEAEGIAAEGSHEAKVFEAVRDAVEGLKIADLPVCWLNCMPARLDVSWESFSLTVLTEQGWEKKCRSWARQSFQRGMDQERQGPKGLAESCSKASAKIKAPWQS